MEDIRIYVADLAAYNNGKLHGVWIDATTDLDEIWNAVNAMLKVSPEPGSEEWAIHDYEGFGSVNISEYEGFESINEKALFIAEHGKLGEEVLAHWCGDLDDARRAMDDDYYGQYKSLADYVEQLTQGTSEIPKHLEFYIDYERMARDMELNGDIYCLETVHDEVHVFWNH